MADENSEKEKFDELPSPEDFCLTVPIYEKFRYDKDAANPFFALEHFKGSLDCYCHGCRRHSVFNRLGESKYLEYHHRNNYIFVFWFVCSRDQNHQICFIFHSNEGILQKIGQYPSLADLVTPDLQKYRIVLGDEGFRELTRAVGLASHGVGVGAFVYLRRIFESLIEKARQEVSTEQSWDEDAFQRCRMDEKISKLRQHLPEFLVENRSLYGIMSVGVHTLSEVNCLDAFPAVRVGIELMLDEQLEKHAREKKIAAAKKGISSLGKSLNGNKTAT